MTDFIKETVNQIVGKKPHTITYGATECDNGQNKTRVIVACEIYTMDIDFYIGVDGVQTIEIMEIKTI